MTRNTERLIWAGVIVLLLTVGALLFLGPAGRMFTMCQDMMGGVGADSGMMQDGGTTSRERGQP